MKMLSCKRVYLFNYKYDKYRNTNIFLKRLLKKILLKSSIINFILNSDIQVDIQFASSYFIWSFKLEHFNTSVVKLINSVI